MTPKCPECGWRPNPRVGPVNELMDIHMRYHQSVKPVDPNTPQEKLLRAIFGVKR